MRWARALSALMAILIALPALAHMTPNSTVNLDFAPDRVTAHVTIPLNELEFATGRSTLTKAELLAGVGAATSDGRAWTMIVNAIDIDRSQQPQLAIDLVMIPPVGSQTRQLNLRYSLLIDRLSNHIVLVSARSDFSGGTLQSEPELIGALRQGKSVLAIDRGPGSISRGLSAAINLGMHHIAEGHDHLLFLLALLLPAPLLFTARGWGGYTGFRPTIRKLVGIVTAFTVGHSLTLIGGAFLGWRLPVKPVEVGIAISILVSAIHAWKPIFAGREAWVAGGFGLVHGMAFATIIGNFVLDPWPKALAILGFNVGIEIVQLLVIAAALPLLIWLVQQRTYPAVRTTLAALTAIAAIAWLAERITGAENVVARTIDAGLGWLGWPLAALSIIAFALRLRQRSTTAA
jgi:HupE / UreJ protein